MTNCVKERLNGELLPIEASQLQKALVISIVDNDKDVSKLKVNLGLLADLLVYLPPMSPNWKGITEIDICSTVQPAKMLFESMRGRLKSLNILKIKVQEEREERAALQNSSSGSGKNENQKTSKGKGQAEQITPKQTRQAAVTKQEEQVNLKSKTVQIVTSAQEAQIQQPIYVESAEVRDKRAEGPTESTWEQKDALVKLKWVQYGVSKRRTKQLEKEWLAAIRVVNSHYHYPVSDVE